MRDLLVCLIDNMEGLNITGDEIHIVGEFNSDDLSAEDYRLLERESPLLQVWDESKVKQGVFFDTSIV